MKVFHISWNAPENAFHEIFWKKSFTVYPCLYVNTLKYLITHVVWIIYNPLMRNNMANESNFDNEEFDNAVDHIHSTIVY